MILDEDKLNILSNNTQVRRGGKVVDNDHMFKKIILNIKIPPTSKTWIIIYKKEMLFKQ